jgi:hypothetical protein
MFFGPPEVEVADIRDRSPLPAGVGLDKPPYLRPRERPVRQGRSESFKPADRFGHDPEEAAVSMRRETIEAVTPASDAGSTGTLAAIRS